MKITIIQGAFLPIPPIEGGAVEKIWYKIGQEFANLGHEVVHISRSYNQLANKEKVKGITYLRISGYNTPSLLFQLKLFDLLYSARAIRHIPNDTDIIVTNTFWSPILLRGKRGKKVYVDVERVPRGQMKFYQHVGMLRGCSPFICEAIKKEIPQTSHHLISYVPNPVPFEMKPVNVERKNIILFVGRLHPEKGVHVLIQAFIKLKEDFENDWELVIVGPSDVKAGGGGNYYQRKLLDLAKNNDITFAGPVYEEEKLIDYYSKASIFCYPAQEESGDAAPVAPREAMAYGCVPVVSQLECFNDLIQLGKNGTTFIHSSLDQVSNLATALTMLIKDDYTLRRMSEEGKLISNSLSIQVISKKILLDFKEIYQQRK